MSHLTDLANAQQANLITMNGKSFTNNSNVPKELALMFAWASTQYDGKPTTATNISVSDIIGPMRKLLYKITHPVTTDSMDIMSISKSAIGTILHTGMEEALNAVGGYTQEVRSETTILGVTVSGKFDIVTPDGEIKDLKNISSFAYKLLMQDKDAVQPGLSIQEMYEQFPNYAKYTMQMSIYRYLNQELVTKPYGSILFNLTSSSFQDDFPTYSEIKFPLFPVEEIHEYLVERITLMQQHLAAGTYPDCTPNERGTSTGEYKLERCGPSGKFTTVRGSKFSSMGELQNFITLKGRQGDRVHERPPEHKLCNYCSFQNSICDQQ